MTAKGSTIIAGLGRAWTAAAVIFLNAVLLIVVLNLGVRVWEMARGARFGGYYEHQGQVGFHPDFERLRKTYTEEAARRIFPDLSQDEALGVITASWAGNSIYAPYVQFRPAELTGTHVNVHAAGFRLPGAPQAWPPPSGSKVVFVFGGSTTFGIGVRDQETIPAYLESMLRSGDDGKVIVYNFGRSSYFSTQERILFEALISEGHVPDVAVFIDGLNEFYHWDGNPEFTPQLTQIFDDAGRLDELAIVHALNRIPLYRLLAPRDPSAGRRADARPLQTDWKQRVPEIIGRYEANRAIVRAVAGMHGVQPLFVWQPAPFYELRGEYLFEEGTLAVYNGMAKGYAAYAARREADADPPDFLWLASANEDLGVPLYVDTVHYTPVFAKTLAAPIAARVRALLQQDAPNQ